LRIKQIGRENNKKKTTPSEKETHEIARATTGSGTNKRGGSSKGDAAQKEEGWEIFARMEGDGHRRPS